MADEKRDQLRRFILNDDLASAEWARSSEIAPYDAIRRCQQETRRQLDLLAPEFICNRGIRDVDRGFRNSLVVSADFLSSFEPESLNPALDKPRRVRGSLS